MSMKIFSLNSEQALAYQRQFINNVAHWSRTNLCYQNDSHTAQKQAMPQFVHAEQDAPPMLIPTNKVMFVCKFPL